MSFCKFCKDLTTGKDNQTHDIVRVIMILVVGAMLGVMVAGCSVYLFAYCLSLSHPEIKLLNLNDLFTPTSWMAVAIGGFITTGAASILIKKTTEPDGTTTTTESYKSGPGSAEPEVQRTTETTVNMPGVTNIQTP